MPEIAVRIVRESPNHYTLAALSAPVARKLSAALPHNGSSTLAHLILPDQKVNRK